MASKNDAQQEKTRVALTSVGASILLTTIKIGIALLTGSISILADAAHSALDLVAALLTFFAVRFASRPADATHNYGHAKVENLSAFIESGLLLLTAVWIIYEAIHRLIFHDSSVDASIWAFVVMLIAIAIDFTRSRALLRVARKVGSQALEADALNFRTDIWSSSFVILGLLIVRLAESFHLPAWLNQADAIAALAVSCIVIWASAHLARETIDALLDRAPDKLATEIQKSIERVEDVTEIRRLRVRRSGNKLFADVVIGAPRTFTFEQIHELTEHVEAAVRGGAHLVTSQADIDVVVHTEPTMSPTETVIDQIHYLAELQGVHAHDIHVREVNGQLEADFDVEVHANMDLREAHSVATRLEEAVLQNNRQVNRVTTHLEAPSETVEQREEVTKFYPDMATRIRNIADKITGAGSAHDVHLYRSSGSRGENIERDELDLVLHTMLDADIPLSEAHISAEEIKRALRQAYPSLNSVIIHTEPTE